MGVNTEIMNFKKEMNEKIELLKKRDNEIHDKEEEVEDN